jgi:restriction system protein
VLVIVGLGGLIAYLVTPSTRQHPYLWAGGALSAILLVVALLWWRWARQRRRRRTLEGLLALSPEEFEAAVADLLRRLGYRRVRLVGGAGDLAADITGRDSQGNTVVVQCKRYRPGHRVGSRDLQTFIGMVRVHHQADRGIFVTTSAFTDPAWELAEAHEILLVDGEELVRLMQAT